MENDLIRRGVVLKELWYPFDFDRAKIDTNIRGIPAVDAVEVVHGEWINGHESRYQNISDTFTCSVCGEPATKAFGKSVKSRYCPWCGARMDRRRGDGDA